MTTTSCCLAISTHVWAGAQAIGQMSRNDEWADVRGPCGIGECNNAGKELSFLSLNQLTICNTWFTKRSQYLQTWQHPHTKRWHAIDFIVLHQRDRRLCCDCRVVCTADCGSDHRMVCLTLVLPHAYFSRQKSGPKRPRFDISQLKPPPLMSVKEKEHALQLVKAFQASISCSLKATDCQDTIEDTWKSLSNSLLDAGREHLGYAHKRQPDWFDENRTVLLRRIKERRLLHQRWVESGQAEDYTKFKIARTEARAAVRRAKNHWLADVAKQAELGRTSCRGGSTWPAIRSIQRCFQGLRPVPVLGIKNENGTPCQSIEDQTKRWQRHFTKILNVESEVDMTVFNTLQQRTVAQELAELPTEDEIAEAVSHLRNNKAPGQSGILPEMVRYGGSDFLAALLSLVHCVWNEGCVP